MLSRKNNSTILVQCWTLATSLTQKNSILKSSRGTTTHECSCVIGGLGITQVDAGVCAQFQRQGLRANMKSQGKLARSCDLCRQHSICPKKNLNEMKIFIVQVFVQAPSPCSSSFCPLILSKSSRALPCPKAQPIATSWEGLSLQLQLFRGSPISRSSLSFYAYFTCHPHTKVGAVSSLHSFSCSLPLIVQKHFHCFNENQQFQRRKLRYFLPTLPKLISQDTLVLWDKRGGSRGEGVLWSKTPEKLN